MGFTADELEDLFTPNIDEPASPANIACTDGTTVNTSVVFVRAPDLVSVGEGEISTAEARAEIRSTDIDDAAGLHAVMSIYGLLLLQNGQPLLWQDGTPALAVVYKYFIVDIQRKSSGISTLILSEELP